jgi:hypothetical protein
VNKAGANRRTARPQQQHGAEGWSHHDDLSLADISRGPVYQEILRKRPDALKPRHEDIVNGRKETLNLFRRNPFRKHIARPALQGEYGDGYYSSFPRAIVVAEHVWNERPAFQQYVLRMPHQGVDWLRDDPGEVAARALFALAEAEPCLRQYGELFSVQPAGDINLMGVTREGFCEREEGDAF